jgi:hypothetical protein
MPPLVWKGAGQLTVEAMGAAFIRLHSRVAYPESDRQLFVYSDFLATIKYFYI